MELHKEDISVDIDFGPIVKGMFIITFSSAVLIVLKSWFNLEYAWIIAFAPIIIGWFHIIGLIVFKVIKAIIQKTLDDMFGNDNDLPPTTGSL